MAHPGQSTVSRPQRTSEPPPPAGGSQRAATGGRGVLPVVWPTSHAGLGPQRDACETSQHLLQTLRVGPSKGHRCQAPAPAWAVDLGTRSRWGGGG